MEKIQLTATRIDKFLCSPDKLQSFLFDLEIQWLAVRAIPTGKKVFIFESKLNKANIRITIGDVSAWNIEDARKEARRLKTLCDSGTDPRIDKANKLEDNQRIRDGLKRQTVTTKEAWDCYVDTHRQRWGDRHLEDHIRMVHFGGEKRKRAKLITVAAPLAKIIQLKLSDITPELIESWLKKETLTRPTRTALAFRLLRAFLNWCMEQKEYSGLIKDNAHNTKRVRLALPKPKAKGGCLQKEQLPLWFRSVNEISSPTISAYCQIVLLTGFRREELMKLKWSDIDFRWKSVTLADKVEGARVIPLTPHVEYLFSGLPKINQWVFASNTSKSGHLIEPRQAHMLALMKAGLPHLTFHDLRRSFGTLAEWVECPVGISAQIMGHKPSALAEKHYRRRPLDLLRMWHEKIESWLLNEAQITFDTSAQNGKLYLVR